MAVLITRCKIYRFMDTRIYFNYSLYIDENNRYRGLIVARLIADRGEKEASYPKLQHRQDEVETKLADANGYYSSYHSSRIVFVAEIWSSARYNA